tara:strand:- start:45 stop:575 length:531 start_codon:yes stop_codon:yes gene_type:complete
MIPFPKKKYNIIYADPPWDIETGWRQNFTHKVQSRKLKYPVMSFEQIYNLPIKDISDKDCKLFLWTINMYLPKVFDLIKHWGFKYSTTLVWCKNPNGLGLGGNFSLTTEFLIYASKGKQNCVKRHDTTWFNLKRGIHSKKPPHIRDLLMQMYGDVPRIELFARERILGWDSWGNEV